MKVSIYLIAPLLLILFHSFCFANAYNITEACSKAWGTDVDSYTQCVILLESNPRSANADKPGIIAIASQAAIKQIRINLYMYEQEEEKWEERLTKEALGICMHAYETARDKMEQVDESYRAGGRPVAIIYSSAAMDSIATCVDSLAWRKLQTTFGMDNNLAIHLIHQVNMFIQLK